MKHIANIISIILFACFFEMCTNAKSVHISQNDNANIYIYKTPSSDGTGKFYMGREIAKIEMACRELTLSDNDRNQTDNPDLLIKKMHFKPTDIIADIGAGTGYYTFKLAGKVPLGKVYAVEVQDELVTFLANHTSNYKNIVVVKGNELSPNLPDNTIDIAVMVITYHELLYPHEMLQAIKRSLKANGKILLIEMRKEHSDTWDSPLHRMAAKQIRKELLANGFDLSFRNELLPKEHIMLFEKK